MNDDQDKPIKFAAACFLFDPPPVKTTITSWADKGVTIHGQTVRLQSFRVGKRRFTRPSWVAEFKRKTNPDPTLAEAVREVERLREEHGFNV